MPKITLFFARHPKFVLRTAQPLSYSRAVSASCETIQNYFAKLAAMYARLNILTKPMQILRLVCRLYTNQGRLSLKCKERVFGPAEKGKNHNSFLRICCRVCATPLHDISSQTNNRSIERGSLSFHCSDNRWIMKEL